MDLQITVPWDDGGDLASLYRWLSRDASCRRHAQISLEQSPVAPGTSSGAMGGTFEVINALFSDASAIAGMGSLLLAYKTWRGTKSKPPAVTIRHGDITVTVTEGSEKEIRPLLDALLSPDDRPGDLEDPGR